MAKKKPKLNAYEIMWNYQTSNEQNMLIKHCDEKIEAFFKKIEDRNRAHYELIDRCLTTLTELVKHLVEKK